MSGKSIITVDEVVPGDIKAPDELKKWVQVLVVEPAAGTSLTKTERKVFNVLLSMAVEQGKPGPDGFFRVTISDIGQRLGMVSAPNTDFYKRICLGLMTPVTFSSPTEGEGERWKARPLVAKVDIDSKKDSGGVLRPTTIYWRFDSDLEPMLLEPERYALLRIDSIAKLNSHAEVALYEICARYQGTGSTGWHPWQWWIPILTGHSVGGKKSTAKTYEEFKYFNARILKSAVEGVNKETEINVQVDIRKSGRTITDIRFLVQKKAKARIETPIAGMDLLERAQRSGIKGHQLEALILRYGEEHVQSALGGLESQIQARAEGDARLEPIKTPLAYVKSILEVYMKKRQREIFDAIQTAEQLREAQQEFDAKVRRGAVVIDGVVVTPDELERRRVTAWRADIKAKLVSLPDHEFMSWVEKARALAEERGNVTAMTALNLKEALKKRTLTVAETMKVFGPAIFGTDWETPPDHWSPAVDHSS